MLSKILRPSAKLVTVTRVVPALRVERCVFGTLVPRTQYYTPIGKKLNLGYAMRVHWEIIPLVVTTVFSLSLVVLAFIWAARNKVDVVFSTHSCNTISRTMNLRQPTIHKIRIIHQRYDPWPEMQDVLDKMLVAERKLALRTTVCSFAPREAS